MRIKRSVVGLIGAAAITGALFTGVATATPDVYHDMGTPTTTTAAAQTSTSGSSATPDLYHDM